MAKTWVLETHTKGTGANMVPLEPHAQRPAATPEPRFVLPKPKPKPDASAPPRPKPKFKVVDVMTRRVLAEGAGLRATVDLLEGVRSVVDVAISVWSHADGRWRLLTHREQNALWELRRAARASPGARR